MTAWEPVIDDPGVAARAEAIIDRTARFYDRLAGATDGPPGPERLRRFLTRITGFDGVPAVPLLFAYLALERGTEQAVASTAAWLDRAVSVTSNLEDPQPWLGNGVAGCGWVVSHVLSRLGEPDPDALSDVDRMLEAVLEAAGDAIDAELTLGLAGLGTYWLEAPAQPAAVAGIARIVDLLRARADARPNGFAWRKGLGALSREHRAAHPHGLYNLGIPHGVPGVIAFLARVCAGPCASPAARELLEGAVAWLLDQRAPEGASVFPCLVDPERGPIRAESRLAWCYGDLGIAAVLLQAGRALQRGDWEREALALATGAAARPVAGSGVADGMFCHGAAGVAHLFHRLHQATGDPGLRAAARRWYRATVEMDDPAHGETGYACEVREPQDAPSDDAPIVVAESYGLAVGVAGVALSLLAGIGRVAPDWDRVLAVAVPGGPRDA